MANQTIYPYGPSQVQPEGVVAKKIAEMEDAFSQLADWAFKGGVDYRNSMYRGVLFFPQTTAGICGLRLGTRSGTDEFFLSPLYDLGDGGTYDLTFNTGVVSSETYPGLVFFDENYNYTQYWRSATSPRTVSGPISSSFRYVRLTFAAANLLDAYLTDNNTGEKLFDGSVINTGLFRPYEKFLDSAYIPSAWKPNSRGDYIGWGFSTTDTASTVQKTDITAPLIKRVGVSATDVPFSVGKIVELPKNTTINLEFSCGETSSDLVLRFLNPGAGTASYYVMNANPRTESVNTETWTHVQMYFHTANYANCYIKDATNNVMLWQGASSTD